MLRGLIIGVGKDSKIGCQIMTRKMVLKREVGIVLTDTLPGCYINSRQFFKHKEEYQP